MMTSLAVWDHFLDEFSTHSKTPNAPMSDERAEALKMKWPLIDEYVNDFEKFSASCRIHPRNQETMGFFLEGLPRSIAEAVLIPPVPTTYAALKEKAIQNCNQRQVIKQIFGPEDRTNQEEGNFEEIPTSGLVLRIKEDIRIIHKLDVVQREFMETTPLI